MDPHVFSLRDKNRRALAAFALQLSAELPGQPLIKFIEARHAF
jgi:hypothetical protein